MFEINLVPDIKAQMIHTQKIRNLVMFLSGVVAAIAVGLVVILIGIKSGQDLRISAQDSQLKKMSDKLEEYDGLSEVLTIQNQLNNLELIGSNKKLFSRVFMVMATLLPTGADTVTISSMDVNLDESLLTIEGQANAGPGTDGIDYRVLDSFAKQAAFTKYDYGRYVDKEGNEIPTMCISETDELGMPLTDENGRMYAYWTKGVKGCDPTASDEVVDEEAVAEAIAEAEDGEKSEDGETTQKQNKTAETVTIYRTPVLAKAGEAEDDWYKKGYMSMDGSISGVEHFESQCISYTGAETTDDGKTVVKWTSTNSCDLSPEGMTVDNSSNGRDSGG